MNLKKYVSEVTNVYLSQTLSLPDHEQTVEEVVTEVFLQHTKELCVSLLGRKWMAVVLNPVHTETNARFAFK